MIKKILIIICVFLLCGCTTLNINKLTFHEIVDNVISKENKQYNTNNKGYRYFLPTEFSVSKDSDFVQELTSHNSVYYLNVDIVSYYYKNNMKTEHDLSDYEYFTFENDDKLGYLRIRKNNDYFFVEVCYNYAIIEVEVKDSELKYAVSRSMMILNSIKYNDLVIEKYINENDIESKETIYKIPEPKNKNDSKNILQYIEKYEESEE